MSNYKTYPGHTIFPIKTDTACLLKWAWSTVNLESGTTQSCHRTQGHAIDPDNFSNFHNQPEKIKAREDMLNGQWPGNGCEYCKNVEDVGGLSDRLMTLQRHHGVDKIPPELYRNPVATEVTPIILEVYFNNTCNLSCMYCNPALSSKWNDEIQKFGKIKIESFNLDVHVTNNDRYDRMVADLWKYLEENDRYKTIRHYQVLGGESLLQKELETSFDFWAKHPNPALTINLITNMMIPHHQFVKKMQRVKELVDHEAIYMLELTASLDCWGPEQEYVRYGLDLNTWQQNFEYMLDKSWCKLSVHSCISSLTIKTLPELIQQINHWNKSKPLDQKIEHNFDLTIGIHQKQNGMHPCTFGSGVFDLEFEQILDLMPTDTATQRGSRLQMQGEINFIKNSTRKPEKIAVLKQYLDELDRRRNTNWKKLFTWLDQDWT
jgi:pyruvate-formate lyase-activating enzyme